MMDGVLNDVMRRELQLEARHSRCYLDEVLNELEIGFNKARLGRESYSDSYKKKCLAFGYSKLIKDICKDSRRKIHLLTSDVLKLVHPKLFKNFDEKKLKDKLGARKRRVYTLPIFIDKPKKKRKKTLSQATRRGNSRYGS